MTGTAAPFQGADEFDEGRQRGDRAVGYSVADPHQFLFDHPPGANGQMANLGIAHLPVRQTDVTAGGLQESMRRAGPEGGEIRHTGEADSVVGRRIAPAEPIKDYN